MGNAVPCERHEMRVPAPLTVFIDLVLVEVFGGLLPLGNSAACMNFQLAAHFYFEIDKDAITVASTHFLQAVNLGNVEKWDDQMSINL